MDICFYFQLHQPSRVRRYQVFDIGASQSYFDDHKNRETLRRVAGRCYLPASRILTHLATTVGARFALSITGTLIEQLEAASPETLASFQALVETGGAELLSETSHHSLAALENLDEFAAQVTLHRAMMKRTFGIVPKVFRNTELIVSDALTPIVAKMGYAAMLVEGAEATLGWQSPNHVYGSKTAPSLRLLARNYRLSDDVAFRFSARDWPSWPLTADRYAEWVAAADGDVVNVFMDFETFGEHQHVETGILDFLSALPDALQKKGVRMVTPSELATRQPVGLLSYPRPTSWADTERDTSAWLGNRLQQAAHQRLYALRDDVLASGDAKLIANWRRLSTSDHFYYMSTKWHADGDVHLYFNPYATPYDAYISFMNVLRDLEQRLPGSQRAQGSALRAQGSGHRAQGDGRPLTAKAAKKAAGKPKAAKAPVKAKKKSPAKRAPSRKK